MNSFGDINSVISWSNIKSRITSSVSEQTFFQTLNWIRLQILLSFIENSIKVRFTLWVNKFRVNNSVKQSETMWIMHHLSFRHFEWSCSRRVVPARMFFSVRPFAFPSTIHHCLHVVDILQHVELLWSGHNVNRLEKVISREGQMDFVSGRKLRDKNPLL